MELSTIENEVLSKLYETNDEAEAVIKSASRRAYPIFQMQVFFELKKDIKAIMEHPTTFVQQSHQEQDIEFVKCVDQHHKRASLAQVQFETELRQRIRIRGDEPKGDDDFIVLHNQPTKPKKPVKRASKRKIKKEKTSRSPSSTPMSKFHLVVANELTPLDGEVQANSEPELSVIEVQQKPEPGPSDPAVPEIDSAAIKGKKSVTAKSKKVVKKETPTKGTKVVEKQTPTKGTPTKRTKGIEEETPTKAKGKGKKIVKAEENVIPSKGTKRHYTPDADLEVSSSSSSSSSTDEDVRRKRERHARKKRKAEKEAEEAAAQTEAEDEDEE